MTLTYLASPYFDADHSVIQSRMEAVYKAMHELTVEGHHVLTPLAMHEVAIRNEMPQDYLFWEKYCLNILRRCDKLCVLTLDGWEKSRGVKGEIEFAIANSIPVIYRSAN